METALLNTEQPGHKGGTLQDSSQQVKTLPDPLTAEELPSVKCCLVTMHLATVTYCTSLNCFV